MSFLPRRKTNTMKGLPPFPRNFFLASSGFTAPPLVFTSTRPASRLASQAATLRGRQGIDSSTS